MNRFEPKGRHSSVLGYAEFQFPVVGLTVGWNFFFEAKEKGLDQ